MPTLRHLRWGILGTGNIAGKFARDLASVADRATLVAVGSRDAAKAESFRIAHGAQRAHASYAALVDDPGIDTVYISLPNHLHAEWALRCAQAGKHVLCEKPAMLTTSELEAVLALARRSGTFFMEAYAYRCHARCARLTRLIADGAIGAPRLLHASFAFDGSTLGRPRLWDAAMGGGALMDVGVYPLSWLRLVAGEPLAAQALAHVEAGVDHWTAGTLAFAGGAIGTFTTALRCATPTTAVVHGATGAIDVVEPWRCPPGAALVLRRPGHDDERFTDDDGLALYAREALTVAAHVDAGQAPACTWADSLGQARLLDALRAQIGVRWPDAAGDGDGDSDGGR